jgi:hypothetical protein
MPWTARVSVLHLPAERGTYIILTLVALLRLLLLQLCPVNLCVS